MNTLGKYITQVRGISYKPEEISELPLEDYVPILKANNIKESGLDESDLIYIHKSKIKSEQFIRKGDLLIAASSGSKEIVGKHIFFDKDYQGSFGAFCKVVRPKENIYPEFVSAFFKTPTYRRHIRKVIQGANINNLRNEHINNLVIAEFSFADQIKIATVLNKAEALIKKRKENIGLFDEVLKNTFLKMFGRPIEMKDFKLEKLGSYIKFLTSGSRGWAKHYSNTGAKFLRIQNIWKGNFRLDDLQLVDVPDTQEAIRTKVQAGDLLMTVTADLGRTAVVPKDFGDAFINQHLVLVRLDERINPMYAAYFFFMPFGYSVIQKKNKSAVKAGLNFNDIKTFEIFVPAIELQNRFVEIVTKAETLKDQFKSSLTDLENLYGSLSQKGFRGELDLSALDVFIQEEEYQSYSNDRTEPDHFPPPKIVVKKKEEPEDKRYGDPFEVDEATAKKQGEEFYRQWQELHPVKPHKFYGGGEAVIEYQWLATQIKKRYENKHFNFEMLMNFIKKEKLADTVKYYSSEEMKANPKLNDAEDVKAFLHTSITNVLMDEEQARKTNLFLKLKQVFYNAEKENFQLILHKEDFKLLKNRTAQERSGIYFTVEQ